MPRTVDPAVASYRSTGRPVVERRLIWVSALLHATGEPVSGGFWNGRETQTLEVIDPATNTVVSRPYFASGSLIEVEPLGQISGLDIHAVQVTLSAATPEVINQLQAYNLRGAAVEMHRVWFDYDTRLQLAPAHLWMTGMINRAPHSTPPAGGTAKLVYSVVPMTRQLTFGNPEVISDAVQQQRDGDRFLRHAGVAGVREIPWMRHRVTAGGTDVTASSDAGRSGRA